MTTDSTYTAGGAVLLRESRTGRVHRSAHFDMGAGDADPIRGTIETVTDISEVVDETQLCRYCFSASERRAAEVR